MLGVFVFFLAWLFFVYFFVVFVACWLVYFVVRRFFDIDVLFVFVIFVFLFLRVEDDLLMLL